MIRVEKGAGAQIMTIFVRLADATSKDIRVALSPIVEMMGILHNCTELSHHPEFRVQAETISRLVSERTSEDIAYFSPLWSRFRSRLFFIAAGVAGGDTPEEELRVLANSPRHQQLAGIAQGLVGVSTWDMPKTGFTIESDRAEFVSLCRRRSGHRGELAVRITSDPDELLHALFDFLHRFCHEAFNAYWAGTEAQLRSTVETMRRKFANADPIDVLSQSHPSVRPSSARDGIVIEKLQSMHVPVRNRGLVVIPTIAGAPHLTVKADAVESPVCITLPFATPSPTVFSSKEIAARMHCLSSSFRLELCRHLAAEAITTSELAERIGVSRTQVSRELRMLKDVGLLRSSRRGKLVFHSLDLPLVESIGNDLVRTILR